MKPPTPETTLSPAHLEALRRALFLLERTSFVTQLAEHAGRPANYVLRMMPKTMNDRLNRIAEIAILKSLDVAIKSLKPASKRPPTTKLSSLLVGISGGVSGFLGAGALPVELPLTTIFMLRAIADIARHQGENLSTIEGRLACVEVFALGDRGSNARMDLGYYASRALLSKFTKDASAFLSQRGVGTASAPVVNSFISEVASRFGTVVSERVAVGAIPVVGALGGATVNLIFMNHFQNIARGHFIVRRLERLYGADVVRRHYMHLGMQQSKFEARTAE
jgi:EcsC protein family